VKKEFDLYPPKWYIMIRGKYHAYEFGRGKGKSRSEAP